jgi:hypothetical protein
LWRRVLAQSEHDRWGDVYRILIPKQSEYGIPNLCKSSLQPYVYCELTQLDYSEAISRPADTRQYVTHLVDERVDAIVKAASKRNESAAASPPVIELDEFEADTYTAHVGNASQSHNGDSLAVIEFDRYPAQKNATWMRKYERNFVGLTIIWELLWQS